MVPLDQSNMIFDPQQQFLAPVHGNISLSSPTLEHLYGFGQRKPVYETVLQAFTLTIRQLPNAELRRSTTLTALLLVVVAALSVSYRMTKHGNFSQRHTRVLTTSHAYATEIAQLLLAVLSALSLVSSLRIVFFLLDKSAFEATPTLGLQAVAYLGAALMQALAVYFVDIIEGGILLGTWRHPYDRHCFIITRCKIFGSNQTWKKRSRPVSTGQNTELRDTTEAAPRGRDMTRRAMYCVPRPGDMPTRQKQRTFGAYPNECSSERFERVTDLERQRIKANHLLKQCLIHAELLEVRSRIDRSLQRRYQSTSDDSPKSTSLRSGSEAGFPAHTPPSSDLAVDTTPMDNTRRTSSMGLTPGGSFTVVLRGPGSPAAGGLRSDEMPAPPAFDQQTGEQMVRDQVSRATRRDSTPPLPDSDEAIVTEKVSIAEQGRDLEDATDTPTGPNALAIDRRKSRTQSLPPKIFERLNGPQAFSDMAATTVQRGLCQSRRRGMDMSTRRKSVGSTARTEKPLWPIKLAPWEDLRASPSNQSKPGCVAKGNAKTKDSIAFHSLKAGLLPGSAGWG